MKLTIELDEKEVQQLVDALAARPYAEVYTLIPRIFQAMQDAQKGAPVEEAS